ncbi:MAG: AAA family ATPase [Phenylobacterium sp.]
MKEDRIDGFEEKLARMCNDDFNENIAALLRARTPLIYLACAEENRVLNYLKYLCAIRNYTVYVWNVVEGMYALSDRSAVLEESMRSIPEAALDKIIETAELRQNAIVKKIKPTDAGVVYILQDFHRFIDQDSNSDDISIERRLRHLVSLPSSEVSVIITAPYFKTTPTLENDIVLLDFPHPNKHEIGDCLDRIVSKTIVKLPRLGKDVQQKKEEIIKALTGLTLQEAEKALAKSLVVHRNININSLLKEKEQIIKKRGILEFCKPSVDINDVGGLENLIKWLKLRVRGFTDDAINFGLPYPKGALLVGITGTGKSLIAKAISALFELPLLRLDFGRLMQPHVGESEELCREALRLAEQVSPCILWLDEIEKGISGVRSSGDTDAGTTSRMIGTFLTWMQEKEKPIFIVATANDHTNLLPEFMRRFDEVFFVDLPNAQERQDIFEILLNKWGRKPSDFNIDLPLMASKTNNYSGSEIEKAIVEAIRYCYVDNKRFLTNDDLLNAISSIKPLYLIKEIECKEMKEWAATRCRFANAQIVEQKSLLLDVENADIDL